MRQLLAAILCASTVVPAQQQHKIEAVAEEVLLDLVVRDRRGRTVRDLKPDEIRVFENGVPQKVTAFRLVERTAPSFPAEARAARPPAGQPAATRPSAPTSLRDLSLVTLLFERLGTDARNLARRGALDFLETELRDNVLVSVFAVDQELYVLQQFTDDRKRLRTAIDRATGVAYSQFASQSESIRDELKTLTSAANAAQAAVASVGRGSGGGGDIGAGVAEAQMAEMTLDILGFSQELQRMQEGRTVLYSLLALIKEQARMPGRKTILYFSEGLVVPPPLVELLNSAKHAANRANVSFYSIDARGLTSETRLSSTSDTMNRAARTASQVFTEGRAVTREEVMGAETAEASLRMNAQGTLADLAESTGGRLISDSNDLSVGMRQVAEDIFSYYELTYRPPPGAYDGKFRKIAVETTRSGLKLQTRSGYYALPPAAGLLTLPYEAAMMATLNAPSLPRDIPYQSRALRFGRYDDGVEHSIVMEVPLASVSFDTDKRTKRYRGQLSLLALIKDSDGAVVQKLSQRFPLEGSLDALDARRGGDVVFARNVRLQPGRYTLETVAMDQETRKSGVRRTVLVVPPQSRGIGLSSVTLVRRADKIAAGDRTPDDSLRYGDLRMIPLLNGALRAAPGAGLSLYFVAYPSPELAEKPEMTLEILRDGAAVGRLPVELPAADASGRIAYVGTIPIEKLSPGAYQLRGVARQGATSAEEYTFFDVRP